MNDFYIKKFQMAKKVSKIHNYKKQKIYNLIKNQKIKLKK